jgi:prophage antirepressor-like protein
MSAQQIVPFLFEGESLLRVLDREGRPWFVAADVCRTLDIKNVTQAVAALDEDEKGLCSTYTLGGNQEVLVITEGGLYTLILRSRDATKPGTVPHRFRRWVTDEVLPAIRKTGKYEAPEPDEDEDPAETPDGLKLRKVNTAARVFGERAGAQLWAKLGLDWVPAMARVLRQPDLLDDATPPTQAGGGTH